MKLITYLSFAGNCEEALNFYKEALGAEVLMVSAWAIAKWKYRKI